MERSKKQIIMIIAGIITLIVVASLGTLLLIGLLIASSPSDRTEEDLERLQYICEYRKTHPIKK